MTSPTPIEQRPMPQSPAQIARDRAAKFHNWFRLFLVAGIIGAVLVARAYAQVTDSISGTASTNFGIAVPLALGGIATALLTTLPLLGFSHVLNAQASVLEELAQFEAA